jgi:hypothetical protein
MQEASEYAISRQRKNLSTALKHMSLCPAFIKFAPPAQ